MAIMNRPMPKYGAPSPYTSGMPQKRRGNSTEEMPSRMMFKNGPAGGSIAGMGMKPGGMPPSGGMGIPGSAPQNVPGSMGPIAGGMPGQLPFTSELDQGMSGLYQQLANAQVSGRDLSIAQDYAARDAARRGIQGPLAVTLGNEARTGVMDAFGRHRNQQLMQLLPLIMQAQQQEAARRQALREDELAAEEADYQQNNDFWSQVGGVGGGILGGLGGLAGMIASPATAAFINPISGATAGYGLGRGVGGSLANALYRPRGR